MKGSEYLPSFGSSQNPFCSGLPRWKKDFDGHFEFGNTDRLSDPNLIQCFGQILSSLALLAYGRDHRFLSDSRCIYSRGPAAIGLTLIEHLQILAD